MSSWPMTNGDCVLHVPVHCSTEKIQRGVRKGCAVVAVENRQQKREATSAAMKWEASLFADDPSATSAKPLRPLR